MSAVFPSTMPLSEPIRVGGEYKSPYQWAAKLAPDTPGALVEWKNALLWLEGEAFGSEDELSAKVRRILDFLANERGGALPPSVEIEPPEKDEKGSTSSSPSSSSGGWTTVGSSKPKRSSGPKPRWTRQQLAAAIVQQAMVIFDRCFQYAGPSLPISDVYARFDPNEFTYPQLIGAVRDALLDLPSPVVSFGVPHTARYAAAGSPGKGRNFNIKVQRKDSSRPNGYSALAQVHVLWQ